MLAKHLLFVLRKCYKSMSFFHSQKIKHRYNIWTNHIELSYSSNNNKQIFSGGGRRGRGSGSGSGRFLNIWVLCCKECKVSNRS